MKRITFMVMVVVIASLFFSCGTSSPKVNTDLPDFVSNPPISDTHLYGVGYGKQGNDSLSITIAKTNARADIARQINTVIQASVTDYAQEAGVDDNTQVTNFVEVITREITDEKISGAKQKSMEKVKDGGFWVLLEYSISEVKEVAAESFKRNEDAAFAEFKATQALEKLDYQLANNPTVSEPVEE